MRDERRKIMILGGNTAQIPLIKAAKAENYNVVLVDYTTTNPGIALADTHHQVNFMDREKVLEIARQERVEGVISNSEAAMPIVAYISQQQGLVGNTLDSVTKIGSKIDFRILQKTAGVYAPEHIVTASFEEAGGLLDKLEFPIVIKPSKSSGSRGTTTVQTREEFPAFRDEWEACSKFSLDGMVVLEEYVQMQTPGMSIEAEIFVCNGKFLWDGIFTNVRKMDALFVPMTDIFPPLLSEEQVQQVRDNISRMLASAGIVFGEYNVELFYTPRNQLFCIEINARQGGCGMPDLVQKYCGVDMHKLLVTTVMGDYSYFEEVYSRERGRKYIIRHQIFAGEDGIFRELFIAPELRPYITDVHMCCQPGDPVRVCSMAGDVIAWVDLEFSSREQQMQAHAQLAETVCALVTV